MCCDVVRCHMLPVLLSKSINQSMSPSDTYRTSIWLLIIASSHVWIMIGFQLYFVMTLHSWLSSALLVDIFSCNFFHKMNIWNRSKWNVPCKFIHHWQYDMIELLLLNHMTVEKLLVWSLVVSRHFRQFAPTFVTRLCYCPHIIRSLKQTVCTKLWYPLPKHLSVLNFNGFDICEISYNLELFVGKDFILWKET